MQTPLKSSVHLVLAIAESYSAVVTALHICLPFMSEPPLIHSCIVASTSVLLCSSGKRAELHAAQKSGGWFGLTWQQNVHDFAMWFRKDSLFRNFRVHMWKLGIFVAKRYWAERAFWTGTRLIECTLIACVSRSKTDVRVSYRKHLVC